MCTEQAFIFPGCHHFSTHRLQRCHPRGRASACRGKTIVSQVWAHQSLCSSCRAAGRPNGEITANPAAWSPQGGHLARAEQQDGHPWLVYTMYAPYPVGPPASGTAAGGNPPQNTQPTPPTATSPPAATAPANNRPWEQFIDRTPAPQPPPPPPPPQRGGQWEQLMDRTPAPAPQPAGTVNPSPWREFMNPPRASATTPREGNNPWLQYQSSGVSPVPPPTSPPATSGQGGPQQTNNLGEGNAWAGFHVNNPTTPSNCRTVAAAVTNPPASAAWAGLMEGS